MTDFSNNGSLQQIQLFPVVEVVSDDMPMGVLNDGTPYLTLYGLAKLCGIDDTPLRVFTSNWETEKHKPRGQKVSSYLASRGFSDLDRLYTRVVNSVGVETHAYPDYVCMAILRYYAFDANNFDNSTAVDNFVRLAEYTLKRMIYERSGYQQQNTEVISESWNVFQQRIIANDSIPIGYFSIFREMADLTVRLINSEFKLDPHSIPDISVGQRWAKYWKENNLAETHGERTLHPHNYPDDFPQSKGTQKEAYIYPNSALGIFRDWLYTVYVNIHLKSYLANKVQQRALPAPQAEKIILALQKPTLPKPH
ncbi:hypothetical protein L7Q45_000259 [Citrobacter braakii]|uniref:hypothetical protein n=1 Tax=Citrobacter TaxID=544 RepID=UPI0005427E82|nr:MULTISPECIES: hypothetical protein [Citrobacter]EIV2906012.1 hypothetical protein [Citrobacter braakii]KHE10140.1 hypothetical protein LH87_09830 [Citrobacter braakii]MDM3336759.1 hypothetical protein [Citrobacter sp. Cb043]MDM3465540.1 hypothetical protein [Citrobacter sp. Cb031]MEB2303857.1 hypothetical protein [Citrobacter braakii]